MTDHRLPLEGIRVLDLTRVLAGPWAAMSLADLGAEVWKIENIKGGDDSRAWSMPNYKGVSTYYLCANRGKQSIALDLKAPEGRQIVLDLAAKADVIVENFRAGTVDRLGLGYRGHSQDQLRHRLLLDLRIWPVGPGMRPPRLRLHHAGRERPHVHHRPGGRAAESVGVAITDVVAGMVASQAILAALYQRRDTGHGQFIDIALLNWH